MKDEHATEGETEAVDLTAPTELPPPKRPVGFGRMTLIERTEAARRGGKSSQASGKGHRWTKEQAAENGRRIAASRARKREESAE